MEAKNFTIFNIQRYAIHDGDGIRTSIFLKGCPLRCAWCHNPESQIYEPELIFHEDHCTGCGRCQELCPAGAISFQSAPSPASSADHHDIVSAGIMEKQIAVTDRSLCKACGSCVIPCPTAAREIAGKQYSVSELVKIVERDRAFYEQSDGGVTLSGGEPLARNVDGVAELLSVFKRRGISTAIDTCGFVPWSSFLRVLPVTDMFLYDFKLLDTARHKLYTEVDNRLILDNLCRLSQAGAVIDIRIPVIGGVNDDEGDLPAIAEFLKEYNIAPRRVHLLSYHNTGSAKFQKLDRTYTGQAFTVPTAQYMETMQQQFEKLGFLTVIGG